MTGKKLNELETPVRGGAKKPGSTGWDGFEDQPKYFADLSRKKAKGSDEQESKKVDYYIEHLPRVMEIAGNSMGPRFMRFWLSQGYKKDDPDAIKNWRSRALDHDTMVKWKYTKKHDKVPDIFNRKDDIVARIKRNNALPSADGAVIVPNPKVWNAPDSKDAPNTNHADWAEEVDKWSFWEENLSGDGAGPVDMGLARGSLDDLMLTIGRFTWMWIPTGVIQKFANTYNFKISGYALFAYDTYSFEGPQALGFWNVDISTFGGVHVFYKNLFKETDGSYKPGMGWVFVDNKDFRRYRGQTGKGLDIGIYSDLKQMPLSGEINFSFT